MVKDLSFIQSDEELNEVLNSRDNEALDANLSVLNEFVSLHMPSFVNDEGSQSFYHLNMHRNKSFTR